MYIDSSDSAFSRKSSQFYNLRKKVHKPKTYDREFYSQKKKSLKDVPDFAELESPDSHESQNETFRRGDSDKSAIFEDSLNVSDNVQKRKRSTEKFSESSSSLFSSDPEKTGLEGESEKFFRRSKGKKSQKVRKIAD